MDDDVVPVINVCVALASAARTVTETWVQLPHGASVLDALQASGVLLHEGVLPDWHTRVGVWGRKATASQHLCDGDRIELYRPLRVDPKVARRERYRKQGPGVAGLFAGRRTKSNRS